MSFKPEKGLAYTLKRDAAIFLAGLAGIGIGTALFRNNAPVNPKEVPPCVRAIGQSAFYQGEEPAPCASFEQLFPPHAPHVMPMDAAHFKAAVATAESSNTFNEYANVAITGLLALTGGFVGKFIFDLPGGSDGS